MNVEINGCHIHIEEYNQGEPALIWTHGLMSCIAGELAGNVVPFDKIQKQSRFIIYDARGHGESDDDMLSQHHHYDFLAGDMLSVADHFNIESCYLGGTSKGAATALWAAVNAPNRVKGLILHAVPDGWEWRDDTRNLHEQVLQALGGMGVEKFCEQLKLSPMPESMRGLEQKRDIDLTQLADHPTETALAILKGAAASDLPPMDQLAMLRMPVKIFAINQMPGHSVDVAMQLETLLPNAELFVANNQDELREMTQQVAEFIV